MFEYLREKANGVIKKAHVTYTVGIIVGTVTVLTWLNTTYVSASEYKTFKEQTLSQLSMIDKNNRKMHLIMRNKSLDDKLFELQSMNNPSVNQSAVIERIRREMESLRVRINRLEANGEDIE